MARMLVRPVCGMLTHDTEPIGKMDPYCVIQFGREKQRTRTAYSAGRTPNWDDDFIFRPTTEDTLTIQIYDEDTVTADDLVGEGVFPMSRLQGQPIFEDWVELTYRGRSAGRVRLRIQMMMEGNAQPNMYAQPGYQQAGYPPPMGYPQPPPMGYPPPLYYGAQPQYPPASYAQPYPPAAYPQPYPPAAYPQPYPPATYPQPYPPAYPQTGASLYPTLPSGPYYPPR